MQMRKVRLEGKAWMVKTVRVWKKVKKVKKIREYIEAKKETVDVEEGEKKREMLRK